MAQSWEVLVKSIIMDGLPFPAQVIFGEGGYGMVYEVDVKMRFKHKEYAVGFTLDQEELMDHPDIVAIKATALRKMIERQWTKIVADDFTIDVRSDIEAAVADAVAELRR